MLSDVKRRAERVGKFVFGAADDDYEELSPRAKSGAVAAAFDLDEERPAAEPPRGRSYELGFAYYADPAAHTRTYFFTTQLGSPFPSYHSNPMHNFPPRWSSVAGVRMPCESITAPRIRLAPLELPGVRNTMRDMRFTAAVTEGQRQPYAETLNLSHQCLGDPYQYEAFVTFMDLNKAVRVLNLNDNELEDISDLDLSHVVKLHVSHNNLVSFKGLPPLPACEELYVTNNFLSGMAGFDAERFPVLCVLTVNQNPLQHVVEYRQKLKNLVPTLQLVDGLAVHVDERSFLDKLLDD